ncbi:MULTISPECIES: hypothetical protein [unclassified Oceanispirochaeta]|uniref:hypothetical protein n=1 Tax=unclassified Oceanispirochaeta TaxID=2635722 RepID=UPI000E09C7D7|nr:MULTISPECIES: hypothetical protein [unclassified Oceanispirochaeta]MBF9014201.1 hypothetical protein [Oceanispirochaeta sp. M2]NPD70691.1 hypothetical protein [Oceanispirochaeta sp. M1]RDG34451.1 hypothetical protein DV872_01140 [Oceanispirochaeta sp. M1]
MKKGNWSDFQLEGKPDFEKSMQRIEAWYENRIIDRVPVRFHRHNAQFDNESVVGKSWPSLKDRWFDSEYQVDSFVKSIEGKTFRGETFPIFDPNLGPDIFQAFYGQDLEFGEVTSWTHPKIETAEDLSKIKFDKENLYLKKIEEMTDYALQQCDGKFIVGYTDLHPGMDFLASWRGNDKVCMDFYLDPDLLKQMIRLGTEGFQDIFDHFHNILSAAGQPSANWMGIPSAGKLHIPSNDFSALIGNELFDEYCLPILQKEVKTMDTNIFHLDGRGVANHIDSILTVPEIDAIQWVQGVGDDQPIMQWVPFFKKLQDAGMPVIADVAVSELEDFMAAVRPEGICLWVGADSDEEEERILERLLHWS